MNAHHPRIAPTLLFALLLPAFSTLQEEKAAPAQPFRLAAALGPPDWLKISGEVRLRWEGITGQFRSAGRLSSSDHLGFSRTLLMTEADFESVAFGVELIDARHYGGSNNSALATTEVDTVDFLQGYGDLRLGELGSGNHRLRLGRETINLGSRRLVARNGFRNTINAFTGADWLWEGDKSSFRAFWTLPTRRLPDDLESIVDNEIELDSEDDDLQFFGGFFEQEVAENHHLETYLLVLVEDERVRERELYTYGFRFVRPPKKKSWDYETEMAYQFGDIEPSGNAPELDHSAWFQHASVGYTFDCGWTPRLRAAFDYASGDSSPNDGDNERFDTLFGARRFDYGPTGIWGAIARSNLVSPELRVETRPCSTTRWMLAWRGVWLASDRDSWTTATVRDPTGGSGNHVGQQFETQVRWDLLEDSVLVDVGGAYLFDGEFQREAPGGQDTDTAYGYVQVTFKF